MAAGHLGSADRHQAFVKPPCSCRSRHKGLPQGGSKLHFFFVFYHSALTSCFCFPRHNLCTATLASFRIDLSKEPKWIEHVHHRPDCLRQVHVATTFGLREAEQCRCLPAYRGARAAAYQPEAPAHSRTASARRAACACSGALAPLPGGVPPTERKTRRPGILGSSLWKTISSAQKSSQRD